MTGRSKILLRTLILIGSVLATLLPAYGGGLTPEASRAYDEYVQRAQRRMLAELHHGADFLWIDNLPNASREDAYARLNRGDVFTQNMRKESPSGPVHTPGAMIHHWLGTVFIPGAAMGQVLAVVQDYDHHSDDYSPQILTSKILSHSGDDFTVYLRLTQKHLITVVFDTEHEVLYAHLDANHVYSHSHASRIAEVANPGSSTEHDLSSGEDHGFLWRLESYWRFFDTGRGVYVQCEAISLTRDVPLGLDWMIAPFIESVPRESLEFTLDSTRMAVLRSIQKSNEVKEHGE